MIQAEVIKLLFLSARSKDGNQVTRKSFDRTLNLQCLLSILAKLYLTLAQGAADYWKTRSEAKCAVFSDVSIYIYMLQLLFIFIYFFLQGIRIRNPLMSHRRGNLFVPAAK